MNLKQFFSIIEIKTKIVSIGTYAAATSFMYSTGVTFDTGAAILMLVAVLCVDMGTTAFNTYFDYLKGVDNKKHNLEKDKILIHENVDPGSALLTALSLFFLAVIMGFILALWRGLILIPVGALSLAVGFFYTAGPKPISSTPFGEIAAGGFMGSVLFLLVCFVQTGSFSYAAFAASLPLLFTIAQILTVNNTCDMIGDREAGRKTLSIIAGGIFSRYIIIFESLAAATSVIYAVIMGYITTYQLFGIPVYLLLAVKKLTKLFKKGLNAETKGISMSIISDLFLEFVFIYSAVFTIVPYLE